MGVDGACALANALARTRLTELNLSGTVILSARGPWHACLNMHALNSGNLLSDQGTCALAAGLPGSPVMELHLGGNSVGAMGARALAAVLDRTQLRTLYLDCCFVLDEGACVLAAALATSRISTLSLAGNRLSAISARALALALPRTRLTELDLHCKLAHTPTVLLC